MMRIDWCKAGLSWLIFMGLAASAQAQQVGKDDKLDSVARIVKILNAQLLAQLFDFGSNPKTCVVEDTPVCEIEIRGLPVVVDGKTRTFCIAVAPNVQVKPDGGIFASVFKQKLRWKLSQTDLDGKPLAFHEESGIIVTWESVPQVDHRGAWDVDNGGTTRKHLYFTKTQRDADKAVSGYLPVIRWGRDGDEELCAAIDPKIINRS